MDRTRTTAEEGDSNDYFRFLRAGANPLGTAGGPFFFPFWGNNINPSSELSSFHGLPWLNSELVNDLTEDYFSFERLSSVVGEGSYTTTSLSE